ncbi:hypothetical protein E6C48_00005 [Mesorhizobium composti]|uniref:Uncharacterized protein n=2 Tax=Ollibium composti TaxID=2675109 RepID=A0ABY2QBY1_9HYPH|nr:hypothetical protein E6C48_00005 [Mesorhizobium composti]
MKAGHFSAKIPGQLSAEINSMPSFSVIGPLGPPVARYRLLREADFLLLINEIEISYAAKMHGSRPGAKNGQFLGRRGLL